MDYRVTKVQNVSKNCIVCGSANPASLRCAFYELEGGYLIAVPDVKYIHQSYPGRMHGGVISALIDETIGRAVQIAEPSQWGVTGELKTRFIKPVPLDEEIFVIARITLSNKLVFDGEGAVFTKRDFRLLAKGSGRYIKLSVDKIADPDFLHNEWYADVRNAPETFQLPGDLIDNLAKI